MGRGRLADLHYQTLTLQSACHSHTTHRPSVGSLVNDLPRPQTGVSAGGQRGWQDCLCIINISPVLHHKYAIIQHSRDKSSPDTTLNNQGNDMKKPRTRIWSFYDNNLSLCRLGRPMTSWSFKYKHYSYDPQYIVTPEIMPPWNVVISHTALSRPLDQRERMMMPFYSGQLEGLWL